MKPTHRARSGQSLIELALALPVLLLMLTGLMEFGFALNHYLNALDAAREGARFASDGDPLVRDSGNSTCSSLDFYVQTACVAEQTLDPIQLNPAHDDIVISVFRVLNGHIIDRWPNCRPTNPDDCPNDPSTYPPTNGEWHLWGKGNQCNNGMDDDGDGAVDDGCVNPADAIGPAESTCIEATDLTCHPSHFTTADVEARLDPTAPNTAVILVEVFYAYEQILKLPWLTPFVPDPIRMHSYTIIPVPAAEPSLAISGTVTKADGSAFSGVTISFSTGAVAVSEKGTGTYSRKGFDSGSVTVTASFPGCTFNPPSYNVVLVNQDVGSVNFQEIVCIQTATPSYTPSQTKTPNPIMTSTYTPTPTSTDTPTPTMTPSRTPTPTNTSTCTPLLFDAAKSSVSIITPVSGIVQADNTSTAQIVVTARDDCFNFMAGRPVTLSSSRGGTDSISPASATTDASGQAVFTVKSAVMSPWDIPGNTFTPSVFKATVNSFLLASHSDIKFVCVRGDGVPAGGPNEVFWQFTNSSSMTRRLVRLDITWPQETGRLLQEVRFGGTSIWNLSANFSPVTINSNWVGSPNSRDLNDTVAKTLLVTFNFLVTGSQEFTVKAYWDDTNGNSTCDSGSVTVIRTGAGTAVPTSTASRTPTASATPTSTNTSAPATATPTSTNTSAPTATPTNTTAPPSATPTSTDTSVPPSATPTATP